MTTGASTPTEVHAASPLERPSTPKALVPEEGVVDTPMLDISPGKMEYHTTGPMELTKPGPMMLAQGTFDNKGLSQPLE